MKTTKPKKKPPATPTPSPARVYLRDAEVTLGAWAVFRRDQSNRTAKFSCIHTSKEIAIEQARTLAIQALTQGSTDFTYCVVQIQHEIGMMAGVMVDRGEAAQPATAKGSK